MKNDIRQSGRSRNDFTQLLIPIIAIVSLFVFNMLRDPSFFSIALTVNNEGNYVLAGNLISILNSASELAILAMGMTLVTSSSGGQDISVGATAAIAGSVFVSVLRNGNITPPVVLLGFLACCAVSILVGAFNGVLVAVFKIQPMIATLILFTSGRSIAYWINGGATPTVSSPIIKAIGGFIPGVPVPTPVFIVIICCLAFFLLFKWTNLGFYTQVVGINQQLQPALELMSSQDGYCLRKVVDFDPCADSNRVDQTQEIVGKLRLFAENGLDISSVAVLLDEVEQFEQLESSEIWLFPPMGIRGG